MASSSAGPVGLVIQNLHSPLLGPFDLAVAQGECVAITGPSGAGKSLLLRMIADLDPHEGEVLLNGRSYTSWEGPAWRRQVTYCPAEPGWWDECVSAHFRREDWPAARALLPVLGLAPDLFDEMVQRLSTGERQRMALLRALVREPAVLLLDEPTGALDPASTERVERELRARLACGLMLILVTHDLQQAERLASRRFQLHEGRLHPL